MMKEFQHEKLCGHNCSEKNVVIMFSRRCTQSFQYPKYWSCCFNIRGCYSLLQNSWKYVYIEVTKTNWSPWIREYNCICPSKLNVHVLVCSSHNGQRIYNLGLQTYKINAPVPIIYIWIWLGMCAYLTELYFHSVTLDLMHKCNVIQTNSYYS